MQNEKEICMYVPRARNAVCAGRLRQQQHPCRRPINSSASDGSSDTIKLGGIGALTGGYANYGLSVQHGAQLAVDEINAAGGVNGKQLELNFQDSQGDPESAVSAYGKLMDWGMDVSLGCVMSGETASVVAAAKEKRRPASHSLRLLRLLPQRQRQGLPHLLL